VSPLGVGFVYWPELAPLLEDSDLVDVLEVEPQAYWEKIENADGFHYRANAALLDRIALLPQAKLLHGVGQPIGGSAEDPLDYIGLLRKSIDLLRPRWVSEHLSFNRIRRGSTLRETGFLLPPRQSTAGVDQAVRRIRQYSEAVRMPFAFETGVNYLRPLADELTDGEFFAAILSRTDCGILVDLHNLWCNEQNGRQPVVDVLAQIPPDRVWELHVAGGMSFQGYWLDSHSGLVPPTLLKIAEQFIPKLPNLGAIIFEILPAYVSHIELDALHVQLGELKDLWNLRKPWVVNVEQFAQPVTGTPDGLSASALEEVLDWERALDAALRDDERGPVRFSDIRRDPGLAILRHLIGDARRSSLARALRYTSTLLLLGLGSSETHALLDAYFCAKAPQTFAAIEADCFACFLLEKKEVIPKIPYLDETLAFEHALIRAVIHGASTDLSWSIDPTQLFSSLDEGRLPTDLHHINSSMRITRET
jgi:uncharacterized protein (UPF0276 family)